MCFRNRNFLYWLKEIYLYCQNFYPERFFDILYQNDSIFDDDNIFFKDFVFDNNNIFDNNLVSDDNNIFNVSYVFGKNYVFKLIKCISYNPVNNQMDWYRIFMLN